LTESSSADVNCSEMTKEIDNDVQKKQIHSAITLSVQGAEGDIRISRTGQT
jgi:hypothetical protein